MVGQGRTQLAQSTRLHAHFMVCNGVITIYSTTEPRRYQRRTKILAIRFCGQPVSDRRVSVLHGSFGLSPILP